MSIEYRKSSIIIAVLCFTSIVTAQLRVSLDVGAAEYTIKKEIYGALMENWERDIYTGVYVGEGSSIPNTDGIRNDIIEGFKEAGVSCLAWPGGCFAENYNWSDGIGPKRDRPGGDLDTRDVVRSDGFGTAEYFQLCDLVGTVPYITANVFLPTQTQTNWLNYIDSLWPGKLVYWKMGNEPWGGCQGRSLAINDYLDTYERFEATIPEQLKGELYRVADGGSGNGLGDYWLDACMKRIMDKVEGITYHYYSGLWGSGPSLNFSTDQYYRRLRMGWAIDSCMANCERIMNQYDPDYTVDLLMDEWGAWYSDIKEKGATWQQNTCRDAVIASWHLNVFNNRCRRIKMGMVAQPVNVIHSLFLTDNPPTNDLIKTPTFYVYKMYKVHQEATMVPVTQAPEKHERVPLINTSASVDSTGMLHISMCNSHISDEQNVNITLNDAPEYFSCNATVVNGPEYGSYNDFGGREPVNIKPLPENSYSLDGSTVNVKVPAHSVVTLALTPATGIREQHSALVGEHFSIDAVGGGRIAIHYAGAVSVPVRMELYGIDGRTILDSFTGTVGGGNSSVVWQPEARRTGAGMYVVRITGGGYSVSHRVPVVF